MVGGGSATAVVSSDAGVGKTRLVTELINRCEAQGALALVGACVDIGDGVLPYAPITEALRRVPILLAEADLDVVLGDARAYLARLLPEFASKTGRGRPVASVAGVSAKPGQLFELMLASCVGWRSAARSCSSWRMCSGPTGRPGTACVPAPQHGRCRASRSRSAAWAGRVLYSHTRHVVQRCVWQGRAVAKTTYYISSSIDGFVADDDDSLDWLYIDRGGRDVFAPFIAEIGAFAIGAATYEGRLRDSDVLAHPEKWQQEHAGRPAWVFTHRELPRCPAQTFRLSAAMSDWRIRRWLMAPRQTHHLRMTPEVGQWTVEDVRGCDVSDVVRRPGTARVARHGRRRWLAEERAPLDRSSRRGRSRARLPRRRVCVSTEVSASLGALRRPVIR